MKLSELSQKDVVNDEDGTKLGKIVDLEIDVATGKVLNIHVSNAFRIMNFFNKNHESVSWNKIIKIGHDVVIVEKEPKSKNKNNEISNI